MSTTDTTIQDLEVLQLRGWQELDLPLSFEPGSDYVEYCWLPVLGPTATLKRPGSRDCSGYWVTGSGAGVV